MPRTGNQCRATAGHSGVQPEFPGIRTGSFGDLAGTEVEDCLARLEAVLEALDHDNVRLEQALSLYEEEVQLVRSAERIIATARERVQAVQGQQRGE